METLYTKLGIQEVAVALRTKHLRWYGHVARASSWTNSITSISPSLTVEEVEDQGSLEVSDL